ncbi:MAG: DUF1587 domain-containing protein, partial [Gemmataceae bacterium]|nr:DUF1587 domain-containing protein [Gemmataceae bacterium]
MKLCYFLFGALALTAVLGPRGASHSPGAPATPAPPATEQAVIRFAKDVGPFLTQHCYACHGNGKKRAGLALDQYKDDQAVQKDRKVWENVLHMVRSGEMPPKERPRPDAKEIEAVLRNIEAVLANFDCTGPRSVGRVTLRRLNRTEYNHTIRDLVGIDFQPAADFPNDDVGYGFDNIGDVLSLSPLLLERYLAAAETLFDRAIVIAEPPQPMKTRLSSLRASFRAGEVRRGGALLHSQGAVSGESFFEEGDYLIRVEAFGQQVGEEPVRAALRLGRSTTIKEFEVKAEAAAPATLEAKVRLKTGTNRIGVAFLNPYRDPKAEAPAKQQRQLHVRSIVVDGPYNPPPVVVPESHRRILAHRPDLAPREAAREIVTRFARRAFRRPVQTEEIER